MKIGLLNDFRYACSAFEAARTARCQQITTPEPCACIPVARLSLWCGIMEWGLFSGETERAIRAVFYRFDYKTQRALTFTPKATGDWIARARFWRSALKPTLPAEWYYPTMLKICVHYRKCIIRRHMTNRL